VPYKTDELIEMPFGAWTRVSPMNLGPESPKQKGNFRGIFRSIVSIGNIKHAVDILNLIRLEVAAMRLFAVSTATTQGETTKHYPDSSVWTNDSSYR